MDTAQPLVVNLESKFKPRVPFSLKYSVQNYNGTWQDQKITDQIKSEVINEMHPVNNGGILETQYKKGKHYLFIFMLNIFKVTHINYHLFSSHVLNFSHVKFRGLVTVTVKKTNKSCYWL